MLAGRCACALGGGGDGAVEGGEGVQWSGEIAGTQSETWRCGVTAAGRAFGLHLLNEVVAFATSNFSAGAERARETNGAARLDGGNRQPGVICA